MKRTSLCWPLLWWLASGPGTFCSDAADQAQWGQAWSRNMVSDERNLPDSFDPKTGWNLKWSAELGTETHSTPVVSRGRVYIGTNNGKPRDPKYQGDRGVFMCFDEKNGQLLWQLVVPKLTNSVYWDQPRMGICSPATVESNRVYVVSNRGEVMCLDALGLANGNHGPYRDEGRHAVPPGGEPVALGPMDADIIWLFDTLKECGIRQHDSAYGSILIHGRFLYVNTSNGVDDTHRKIAAPNAPSLIVLDKATGRLVAQDAEHIGPNIFHSTWSPPALAEVGGQPLIIFCGGDSVVYAFEPARSAGAPGQVAKLKKVWQFDYDPAAPKQEVHRYTSNRQESPSNINGVPVVYKNRVYVTVGGDLWWGKDEAWLKCIDAAALLRLGGHPPPSDRSGAWGEGLLWSYRLEKHAMSSPAIHAGLVFVGDAGHRLHCVDAENGKPYWTHEVKGEVWASPLVADGKVYFATRKGEFLVFAEGKEKKLISEIDLGSPISSSPVAANGALYVATMNRLYAAQQGADDRNSPLPP